MNWSVTKQTDGDAEWWNLHFQGQWMGTFFDNAAQEICDEYNRTNYIPESP
jgi:hypothetical protein